MDIVKNSEDAVLKKIKNIHKLDSQPEEEDKEKNCDDQSDENLNSKFDFTFIQNSPSHHNRNKSWDSLMKTSQLVSPFQFLINPQSYDKK